MPANSRFIKLDGRSTHIAIGITYTQDGVGQVPPNGTVTPSSISPSLFSFHTSAKRFGSP